MSKQKNRRGMTRVEFLANVEKIIELSDKGYSLPMIYDALKLQMSLKTFRRYVKGGVPRARVVNLNTVSTPKKETVQETAAKNASVSAPTQKPVVEQQAAQKETEKKSKLNVISATDKSNSNQLDDLEDLI